MQINSINNNSNPNFGMAANFQTKGMSRKAIDICTKAATTIKKEAKGLDINVEELFWDVQDSFHLSVSATTHRNFFQKLFGKEVKSFGITHVIDKERSPQSIDEYVKLLEETVANAKNEYFEKSTEVGKQNLKKALKGKSASEKKYPPYVGDQLASIKSPERIVKKKTKELQDPELRTGPLPWHEKR